jgi:PAS domain S-box-containing protein
MGIDGGEASTMVLLAGLLAPFAAAVELAENLAFEVAARSREVDTQRLFTSLIIDSLPVGLYVVDRDYRIQVWNRKRETGAQGIPSTEAVNRSVFEVLSRQPAARLRAEFDRVFATGEISEVDVEVSVDGETRWYRSTKIPMRLNGRQVSHVITIGADVTESKAFQEQILQSEKLAAIGQLAAGVMHEINNPLATIGACVAALEGRAGDLPAGTAPPIIEYLEIIDGEVQRCTQIVNGLLDFSRPKGKAQAPVVLNTLVEHTLKLLKHHERFREFTVTSDLAEQLPPAQGNEEQLVQVLLALLLNAIDAMPHGGRLNLRTWQHPQRLQEVILEVEDSGVGIPRGQQSKIFEPFYTTKPPGRGTGLGLSICYGIIEAHRGRIEVDSLTGRGATFRVVLPVAVA